jgi:hypothetical protein
VKAFDPADITPEKLAREHRALLQAQAARAFHIALAATNEEDDYVNP